MIPYHVFLKNNRAKGLSPSQLAEKYLRLAAGKQPAKARAPPKRQPIKARAPPKRQPAKARAPPKRQPAKARAPPKRQPAKARAAPKRQPAKARAAPKRQPAKARAAPQRQPAQARAPVKQKAKPRAAAKKVSKQQDSDSDNDTVTTAPRSKFAPDQPGFISEASRVRINKPGYKPARKPIIKAYAKPALPGAKSTASVWCEMGHNEVENLFIYYGLQKMSLSVKEDIARWDAPNYFCHVLEKMFPTSLVKKYTFVKYLGQGAFGHVYEIRKKSNGQRGAIKLMLSNDNASIAREISMQKKLHSIGVAPPVWDHCSMATTQPSPAALRDLQKRLQIKSMPQTKGKRLHMIMMQRIDGVLAQLLQKKLPNGYLNEILYSISDIIKRIGKSRMTHGDMHWDNLSYLQQPNGKMQVKVIDAGFTTSKAHWAQYEWMQLYRTCVIAEYQPTMNSANRKYLQAQIRLLVAKRHKFTLPQSEDSIENLWGAMYDKYHKTHLKM